MRKVLPGSTINSDSTNVYKCLGNRNYTHNFVVHERFYVDPRTGHHSNHIENVWSNLNIKIKSLRGSQRRMLDDHIDEYIYRYNRKFEDSMFNLMLTDIANFYPI